jgi:hypothetical protein
MTMNCSNLAATGLDPALLIAVGAGIVLAGALLVLVAFGRRRARVMGIVAVVLAIGLTAVPLGAPAAQAAPAGCVTVADDSLSVVQTSTMTGLAPNVVPTAITGRITNVSTDDTYIVNVTVSILTVTKAPGASAGACDASDYVIVAPVMVVGQSLIGGASTVFAGASIGFVDKPTNQDACQGATVGLLYSVG